MLQPQPKSILSLTLKTLVAFGIGFGSLQLLDAYRANSFQSAQPSHTPLEETCQLSQQACEQQAAIIQLSTNIVRPLEATTITVDWPDLPQDTAQLIVSLEGNEMMMGVYKLLLTKQASGQYSGELMLPFCTTNAMTWQGSIEPLSSTRSNNSIKPLNISLRMTQ
jgi:hypothetical protein